MKNNKKGFTLIELLVVIAIIGLLATLSVVALNNARQKSRDAKRVSDIKQVQTALELYFVDQNAYPVLGATTLGGTATSAFTKLSTAGFTVSTGGGGTTYMGQVPAAPTPPSTSVYTYCSVASTATATGTGACSTAATVDSYKIFFNLEGATGGLPAGDHVATPNGIQ